MRHAARLSETEAGDRMVHVENGDGTDRALAEAKVVGSRVERHALRPADLGRGSLGLGKISATDQEWHVEVDGAQRSSGLAPDRAGAAHQQYGMW